MSKRTELSAEQRQQVVAAPAGELAEDEVRIWSSLVRGRSRVVDAFTSGERAYLVLQAAEPGAVELDTRSAALLQRLLMGTDQKVLSIELGVSPSTVAAWLKRALTSIGVQSVPSRMPMLLYMLARGSEDRGALAAMRKSQVALDARQLLVVSASLANEAFVAVLSPAEREVVQLRVRGLCHAEIASARKTSRRTVANQLATAFQRLGVSGRSHLVRCWVAANASCRVGVA